MPCQIFIFMWCDFQWVPRNFYAKWIFSGSRCWWFPFKNITIAFSTAKWKSRVELFRFADFLAAKIPDGMRARWLETILNCPNMNYRRNAPYSFYALGSRWKSSHTTVTTKNTHGNEMLISNENWKSFNKQPIATDCHTANCM